MADAIQKGCITPEYWVSCGVCQEEVCCAERTLEASKATIRLWGWTLTKKYGWVCGGCKTQSEETR